MALQTGNPYRDAEVINISKRELNGRIQGMFRNWHTLGNKNDYMSAFPALLGVQPHQVNDITPIQFTDSANATTSYSNALTVNDDSDIIVLSGVIVSSDQDFNFEFKNDDGDQLYPPVYGSANTKTELSGENILVPNEKGNDTIINVTLSNSGSVSVILQGAKARLNTTTDVKLNPGV